MRNEPDVFRILVAGDFSGRANRSLSSNLAGRRPIAVDCDNFDEVLAGMQPALRLPRAALQFRALEDFHPDRIYQSAEIFQELQKLRDRPVPSERPAPVQPGPGLLDKLIEQTEESSASTPVEEGDLAAFLKRVTAPHLEGRPDPRRRQWAARVDAVAGEQMRAVLHHPGFQALEAAWRAVWMLVERLQPDTELKIHLLDATLEELTADPKALGELLTARRQTWALIAGNFVFGQSEEDAARLAMLGRIAGAAGAPFIAEAFPPAEYAAQPHWQALRRSREAQWIGLALPRFLLRLPYGKSTSPLEVFDFEEMPESVHADYLWGNPAFCCACLIGGAFRTGAMRRQIDGLPLHIYRSGGEPVAKPCAEALLSESDADFLLESGFMPLASMKDRDAVLLVRVQSIADPPAPLRLSSIE